MNDTSPWVCISDHSGIITWERSLYNSPLYGPVSLQLAWYDRVNTGTCTLIQGDKGVNVRHTVVKISDKGYKDFAEFRDDALKTTLELLRRDRAAASEFLRREETTPGPTDK